jgi:hypothetical protein
LKSIGHTSTRRRAEVLGARGRTAIPAALLALCALALPSTALASTATTIKAAFEPDKLGAPTTAHVEATFTETAGGIPSPPKEAVVRLPKNLIVKTEGLTTCSKQTLEERGVAGCPNTSLVGAGTAHLEAPIAGTLVQEDALVTPFLGSVAPGKIVLYLYGDGRTPINQQLVLTATVTGNPASGQIFTLPVPEIPTLPGAPPASVTRFSIWIGRQKVLSIHPKNKYFKTVKVHGRKKRVSFLPIGIAVPKKCPTGGFPFASRITFADGSTAEALAKARCP